MHLGLIAGNGRFPFLVLDAARSMGHDVTVIAAKEEASTDLNDAAERAHSPIHWISLGELGQMQQPDEGRRHRAGGDGGSGEAHEDFRRGITLTRRSALS